MKGYILYARTATEQQGREGISLELQIQTLKDLAQRKNLEVNEIISEIGSGVSDKRNGFNSVLEKLSTGSYDGILCHSLDRLSRDATTLFQVLKLIEQKKLEIVTVAGTYNSANSTNMSTAIMHALFAEHDRRIMGDRIKRGIRMSKLRKKDKN